MKEEPKGPKKLKKMKLQVSHEKCYNAMLKLINGARNRGFTCNFSFTVTISIDVSLLTFLRSSSSGGVEPLYKICVQPGQNPNFIWWKWCCTPALPHEDCAAGQTQRRPKCAICPCRNLHLYGEAAKIYNFRDYERKIVVCHQLFSRSS